MSRLGFVLVALAVLAAGCGPAADLKAALQVTDVSTGYFDAGIVEGKNKLVPSVTFRLVKAPGTRLSSVSLLVVFKNPAGEDTDDVYLQRVEFAEGQQTAPVTARATKGYTGEPPQTRLDMLKNSQFQDLDVLIFAKQSSSQWVELHKARVARQLITK